MDTFLYVIQRQGNQNKFPLSGSYCKPGTLMVPCSNLIPLWFPANDMMKYTWTFDWTLTM